MELNFTKESLIQLFKETERKSYEHNDMLYTVAFFGDGTYTVKEHVTMDGLMECLIQNAVVCSSLLW